MIRIIKATAFLLLGTLLVSSCKKEDSNTATPHRWIKTYSSITLGDDNNSTDGQLLNTRTGQVVKLADAAPVRSQLSLLYYVTYGGNAYLSAPANLASEDAYYGSNKGPIYTTPGAGLDYWNSAEKNSVEVRLSKMTSYEFDQLVSANNWLDFDAAFRKYNDGKADLSFVLNSALNPETGSIYLIELNGGLRCIVQILSASPTQTGGFVRLKIIIEGRDDMSNAGKPLMPEE